MVSLFWRTFLFLSLLLLGCIFAWLQTFRALEFKPRALQSAQQLATMVNLTRAALVHADSIARVSLIKTLVDQENVRIAVREPSDTFLLYDQDELGRSISEALAGMLGENTIVAREMNGFRGLWIGFEIDQETYWLLADPERLQVVEGFTWLVWLAIAIGTSLLGAAVFTRLINRPLKLLSVATSQVREGDFQDKLLDENVPTAEIREVNIGFNRMARQLRKAEQDRTLMLAGISHDLRTPLSRLRLETEMSVTDPEARAHMAEDIEQVNAIIDKFLDYARADHLTLRTVALADVVRQASQPLFKHEQLKIKIQVPDRIRVKSDPVELRRVLSNLLENALRYGHTPSPPQEGGAGTVEVDVYASETGRWVTLTVRDHGPGVPDAVLGRLTEPFFRADQARTSALGSGLGLAIVSKTLNRMGGDFTLGNHPQGGLMATLKLLKA